MVTAGDGILIVAGVIAFGAPNRGLDLKVAAEPPHRPKRSTLLVPGTLFLFLLGYFIIFELLYLLFPHLRIAAVIWGAVLL